MKVKTLINLHKGLTAPFVVALMWGYQNFSLAAWVYLALHGTYGILWLLKDRIYPDKQWEAEIPLAIAGVGVFALSLYWVAPFLLISRNVSPPAPLIAGAISLYTFGIFFHYVSDAQKYFTLKYQPGLITEGLFARCRNTNYMGEIFIYFAFALLAMHWLPFVILALFAGGLFIPNMLKKDKSLARYPEFADYQARSGLWYPKLWSASGTTAAESKGN